MTDNKALELQLNVRQNALKVQETFKDIKKFEQEMKRKEKEMLENANSQRNNQKKVCETEFEIRKFNL